MEKLYEQKPDVKEFDAVVLSCEQVRDKLYHVTLDRSAFYPEGGGQPCDTGTLGQARVTEVHEKEGRVIHYTDREMEPGMKVHGIIDWERRQCHM